MKAKDFDLNPDKKIRDAIYDIKMSHVDFRVLSYLMSLEDMGIRWQYGTYKAMGIHLGGMDRCSVSKSFKRLYELNYLMCQN